MKCRRVVFWMILWIINSSACPAGHQVQLSVPPGAIVAFEGDSLTYGVDFSETKGKPPLNGSLQPRSAVPFPEEVARLLSGRVEILNRGYPGDRSIDGLKRWAEAPPASIVFIMYGTNDCGNFGHRPDGVVDPASFKAVLHELVMRRKSAGARVILMTPPPSQDEDWETKLDNYRHVVREVAKEEATPVVDTAELIRRVPSKWTDGLHLSGASNRALAAGVAAMIDAH
ncbi:lysophospholipase L1-like esterase [Bradyrhizobium sp. GM24.11]